MAAETEKPMRMADVFDLPLRYAPTISMSDTDDAPVVADALDLVVLTTWQDGVDEDGAIGRADAIALAINSYDFHRALIEELCGACQLALSALAPFSHDPAEKSGINLLREAIAKARTLSPANTGGK